MTEDTNSLAICNVKNLSTRAKNHLVANNILTVQDLIDHCNKHGFSKIKRFRNIGQKTIKEIHDFVSGNILYTYGTSDSNPKTLAIDAVATFSTRTKNYLNLEGIHTVQDLINHHDKYGIEKIKKFRNIGKKTIQEICDFLSLIDPQEEQQIRKLKSNIKEYKLAIARMEAELAELKAKRNSTTQQKEH